MPWSHESIKQERRQRSHATYAGWSREQLLERILELESGLYPFAYTLGGLGDTGMSTTMTSKLFPAWSKDPDKPLQAVRPATLTKPPRLECVEIPLESKLHELEYEEMESLALDDGSTLDDAFQVLAVHQYVRGGYVSCGTLDMADIRRAQKLLWPERTAARAG